MKNHKCYICKKSGATWERFARKKMRWFHPDCLINHGKKQPDGIIEAIEKLIK